MLPLCVVVVVPNVGRSTQSRVLSRFVADYACMRSTLVRIDSTFRLQIVSVLGELRTANTGAMNLLFLPYSRKFCYIAPLLKVEMRCVGENKS